MASHHWTLIAWMGVGFGLAACGEVEPDNLVRTMVGPAGGLASSHDHVLTIVLLPGSLDREVEIEIFPTDQPPPTFGRAYRVRPNIPLLIDAEVTYRRVLPSDLDAAAVGVIRLDDFQNNEGYWRALPRIAINPAQQSLIATDHELSLYYGLIEQDSAIPSLEGSGSASGGSSGPSGSESSASAPGTSSSGTDDSSGPGTSRGESTRGGDATSTGTGGGPATSTTGGSTSAGSEGSSGSSSGFVTGTSTGMNPER